MQIYNSLTRDKSTLVPINEGQIGMYVCGPTVYDDSHIGHVVGPVLFDTIARWLSERGYEVKFVNNITDIDDKIIKRSQLSGEHWQDITNRYTQQYFDLLAALNVNSITNHPRATEYIDQMIHYISKLIESDVAYLTKDGVYFSVETQPEYGKLSGRRLEEMRAGARIDRNDDLRHPADFSLWKFAKPDEPRWQSPGVKVDLVGTSNAPSWQVSYWAIRSIYMAEGTT